MSLYVPRGYVRTSDAVERVFEARHPDLAADAVARAVEMQRLAFRHKELSINTSYRPKGGGPKATERWEAQVFEQIRVLERIGELQHIESEVRSLKNLGAIELRVGLAEGDMGGWLCHEDTSPRAISEFRWRSADGLTIVWKAILADPMEDTDRPAVEYAVAIKEVDLVAWLDLNLQTGGEATSHLEGQESEAVAVATTASGARQKDAKPQFDRKRAKALMAAQKVSGHWTAAPDEPTTRKFLLLHFKGVSNNPMREIRRELWPDIKTGPKPKPAPTAK